MSKGDIGTSPAQAAYENAAQQQMQRSMNTWMPVQQYFSQSVQQNRSPLEALARGSAAATARAQGQAAATAGLAQAANSGAGAGSGRSLLGFGRGLDASGTAAAYGMANATSAGENQYVKGLQEVIGMGQADRSTALSGLQSAANLEQGYEEAKSAYVNSALQGLESFASNTIGQMASGGGAMGSMGSMGSMAGSS